jgi:hypothetical protein
VPYSDGPDLVGELRDRGNWSAVDAAYDDPPVSTDQVIHPERYPGDRPRSVSVPDRSAVEWRPFDAGPGGLAPDGRTSERLGEGSLLTALWTSGVVSTDHLRSEDRGYNYSHPATDGWAGDRLQPYRNGERYGYVLATAWDTPGEARQFRAAYLDLLDANGATRVEGEVYRVDEGPFANAFRVTRGGDRVVVVNAPTVEELDRVHPPG